MKIHQIRDHGPNALPEYAFNFDRLPKDLRAKLGSAPPAERRQSHLEVDTVHVGDARALLPRIEHESVALSIWSPPYFVGKTYEADLNYEEWEELLRRVIELHFDVIRPGGFLVINIADVLCFRDPTMPRIQGQLLSRRRSPVTREDVLAAMNANPGLNRYQLAELLGCSEQTIDRRLNGNNIRGGKYETQTRIKVVGGLVERWALGAGFYPYDRRIWMKDPAWENSRWNSLSYRAVDEFEYIFFFWKPGVTPINRDRLTAREWRDWGSRGVWKFPSVRANVEHEAMFPVELPTRVIRLLTEPGEIVLDCFLGSGTTGIAAVLTERRFIGVELLERYAELARRRIAAARVELMAGKSQLLAFDP